MCYIKTKRLFRASTEKKLKHLEADCLRNNAEAVGKHQNAKTLAVAMLCDFEKGKQHIAANTKQKTDRSGRVPLLGGFLLPLAQNMGQSTFLQPLWLRIHEREQEKHDVHVRVCTSLCRA